MNHLGTLKAIRRYLAACFTDNVTVDHALRMLDQVIEDFEREIHPIEQSPYEEGA